MNIKKSIVIDKAASEIFPLLNDFHNWRSWSPWLIAEPEAQVNVAGDGKSYNWEGKVVGAGEMEVNTEQENKHIAYDLTFLKPWKSTAKTYFDLKEKDGRTELSWSMESSLPFFLFFGKKSMETYIGMDYERGLNMLKDIAENGKVNATLSFNGIKEFQGGKYIGIKRAGSFSALGKTMTEDFEKLMPYVYQNYRQEINGHAFSIYHKFDAVKDKVVYTVGVPLKNIPENMTADFISGVLKPSKVHSVSQQGAYKHIGNIWSVQMAHQRAKSFKMKRGFHPMEIYHNSPKDTPENELITEVIFGAK